MPTRNQRQFVEQAIWYFLAQDYHRKELTVVDDGDDSIPAWWNTLRTWSNIWTALPSAPWLPVPPACDCQDMMYAIHFAKWT